MTRKNTAWLSTLHLTYVQRLVVQLRALPAAERMAELLMHLDACSPSDWLRLLGAAWSDLPRITGWEEYLLTRTPLGSAPWPVIEMMDASELTAFIDLPDEFLAFRGALAHNHAGLCWSLDMAQAAAYADRYAEHWVRFGHPRPAAYRLTARIDKSQVVAVKRSDSELTLLVAQVDYMDTEVLRAPHPAEPATRRHRVTPPATTSAG